VLVTDTIPEFLDKGLNKLHYDGRDLYENILKCLEVTSSKPGEKLQVDVRSINVPKPISSQIYISFSRWKQATFISIKP
jgi:hypothetical protein